MTHKSKQTRNKKETLYLVVVVEVTPIKNKLKVIPKIDQVFVFFAPSISNILGQTKSNQYNSSQIKFNSTLKSVTCLVLEKQTITKTVRLPIVAAVAVVVSVPGLQCLVQG